MQYIVFQFDEQKFDLNENLKIQNRKEIIFQKLRNAFSIRSNLSSIKWPRTNHNRYVFRQNIYLMIYIRGKFKISFQYFVFVHESFRQNVGISNCSCASPKTKSIQKCTRVVSTESVFLILTFDKMYIVLHATAFGCLHQNMRHQQATEISSTRNRTKTNSGIGTINFSTKYTIHRFSLRRRKVGACHGSSIKLYIFLSI